MEKRAAGDLPLIYHSFSAQRSSTGGSTVGPKAFHPSFDDD